MPRMKFRGHHDDQLLLLPSDLNEWLPEPILRAHRHLLCLVILPDAFRIGQKR